MSRPERIATIAARYLAQLTRQENTMTADPDPLDIACAIEYFDEHGQPLNAAAIRNLVDERDKLAATVAAIPDAHHAANLAHARAERDQLRQVVMTAAAECHRRKWAYDGDSDAFKELHRLGEELRPVAMARRGPETPTT